MTWVMRMPFERGERGVGVDVLLVRVDDRALAERAAAEDVGGASGRPRGRRRSTPS